LDDAPSARGGGATPRFLLTAACHDASELARAAAIGADLALLSPAFATASHPGAEDLGPARFRALAAGSPLPLLALGGVDGDNARLLAGRNVAGIAAIGAFVP
jgi:thiamine monophosphate synthase